MKIFKPYNKDIDYFFIKPEADAHNTDILYFNDIDITLNENSRIQLITNRTEFHISNTISYNKEYMNFENIIYKYPINNYLIGDSFLLDSDYNILLLFCFINGIPTVLINYSLFSSTDKLDKKIMKNLLKSIGNSSFSDIEINIFKTGLDLFTPMETNSTNIFNINDKVHKYLNKINIE